MPTRERLTTGILAGAWFLLILCGDAWAQTDSGVVAAGASSPRAMWQRRVLRRGTGLFPSRDPASAYQDQTSQSAQVLPVSTAEPFSEETANVVQADANGELTFDSLPDDSAYESIDPDPLDIFSSDAGADTSHGCGHDGSCESCGPCEDCGGSCGGWDVCGNCQPEDDGLAAYWCRNDLSLFAGVHGFKGPPDQGRNGNFGIHEGVNFGAPMGIVPGLGYQLGLAAVHSNFAGDQAGSVFRGSDRDQIFVTAGIFRRAQCHGMQWGIAFDLLHDSYFDTADLKQIRTETGFVGFGLGEIGFWGAYGVGKDDFTISLASVTFDPTDMYAFYFRRYFDSGGDGRFWGGFTGRGDGLLGADLRLPLGRSCALENRLNYLLPRQDTGADGQLQESWGLSIRVVWYPGRPARRALRSPYRPLFDVADNTFFMSDRVN